jgi:hypothetical protein
MSMLRLTFCAAAVALFVGCGESTGPVGQVHGKVTIKGAPAPTGCTVSFIDGPGVGAATVDASGNYATKTGVPVGKYSVIITPPAGAEMSPEEAMKATQGGKALKIESNIPAKYMMPGQSPLSVEIKAGDTEYNIDITD